MDANNEDHTGVSRSDATQPIQPIHAMPAPPAPIQPIVMTEAPPSPSSPSSWFRRNRVVAGCTAVALALVIGGGGYAFGALSNSISTSTTASTGTSGSGSSNSGTLPSQQYNPGSGGTGTGFGGSSGSTSQRASTQSAAVAATAAQKVGVVTIVSTLDYDDDSQAAGTGTIMTSNGLILTNNHVIEGATSIKVTVESTNKTYTATVVGTDATDDVAVLQLTDASGLSVAKYDSSGAVSTGDAVTDVGNAEGTGDLVAATGTVTATAQSITVQGDTAGETESLTNLIEISADVVSGDSGGPLLDDDGEVIGMVTAASSGSTDVTGYAIPIKTALTIAKQIENGVASANVTIGYPAFLGVQISSTTTTTTGVPVAGAIAGTPAATLGIVAGDTITAVNGTAVTTADSLSAIISAHKVGDRVTVTWTDAAGTSHTATATLAAGPAA
jgi:S1-C subfamily serine protease